MRIISKQLVCQKYIYKIHSSRLRQEKWNLILPLSEARRNDEVISIADSQVLRWIDELNGIKDADKQAKELKSEIKILRREPNSVQNKRKIRSLYQKLDELQYKPDYLCLIIDRRQDYYRACKGFFVNGVKYFRLLGTNGGIKNSTIVFMSERYVGEIRRRIDNGRDLTKELVPAKLEAYRSLTCSASIPVSMPKGIVVVNDCETKFTSDVIYLTDDTDGEPIMEYKGGYQIDLNASDGFGLMLPSLADRWSKELGLDYTVSGCNTRYAFEKGMVYTFDFLEFGHDVAHGYTIKDAWGNSVDLREAELILTTSMVKLWDSYKSCEEYLSKSNENGYTFSIAKTCPKELEDERNLNYQFIQSYDFSKDDIEELIEPTLNEIKDVLGGDWRKTVLFLKGAGLNEKNVLRLEDDFIKAIMIDRRMVNDPYIQGNIYQLIKHRINDAKVGVLRVHGNYSMVSGDPYALCQSIFNLQITGLLKSGEIYNRYWADRGAKQLVCLRAPMTCHNNIRSVMTVDNAETRKWYRYLTTCTVFNAWDTATSALNGCDFDGDLVMLTDNPVMIRKLNPLPALLCVQRKAQKKIPDEEDLIRSNIESFGNEIGQTTNWITSMFEVQSHFDRGSPEHDELSYRIRCGQLYQQNAIDKAKGIICKPMPKSWHDRHAANKIESEEERQFYRSIVADKKPYFMRYIYPALRKQYNTYIKNTTKNALREFQMTVEELRALPHRSQRQDEFLKYYDCKMPVGVGDCVMNHICRRFEEEFDRYILRSRSNLSFDYQFLKSDAEYSASQYRAIQKLYEEYNQRLRSYLMFADQERVDEYDSYSEVAVINTEFRRECDMICPNRDALCNIILDLCYTKNATKKFAWSMCGSEIIHNLYRNNGYLLSFPAKDPDGEIEYDGYRFSVQCVKVEGFNGNRTE